MNEVPRSLRFSTRLATMPEDVSLHPVLSARATTRRHLLRPRTVEKAVIAADLFAIFSTILLSNFGYFWTASSIGPNVTAVVSVGLIFAVNFGALNAARGNYQLKNLARFSRQVRETVFVWTAVFGMLVIAGFAMKISTDFSRGASVIFFVAGLSELILLRAYAANFIARSLAKGSFAEKRIIVIAEKDRAISSQPLVELKRHGFSPVNICQISKEEIASCGASASLREKLAELIEFARAERIEDVYLLVAWNSHRAIDSIVNALAVLPITVHLIPDESAAYFLKKPMTAVGNTCTAELRRAPLTTSELAMKRAFDLIVAITALALLSPLMLITAILIRLDAPGPVFFRQQRNGFNGYAFRIFKFRTMDVLEDGPLLRQTTRNDPRVTRVGRWLRRSSIDELPQLFNVIRGEMSLVGPRPHAISHDCEYGQSIAAYAFRQHVKPGITGWAQVSGFRGETRTLDLMERRVEHDLWYINNWSLFMDLKIMLQTVLISLRQTSAY